MELGVHFPIGSSDVAQAARACHPIKHSRVRYEPDAVALKEHTAEVLAIIVAQQLGVPGTCGFGQLATNEPRSGLHLKIVSHLLDQPLSGRQIAPQGGRFELSSGMSVHEPSPR